MIGYTSRSYEGPSDLSLLINFTRAATAERYPESDYWHVGDAVWQLYALGPSDDVRLWFDGDGLAGFVSLEPPAVMHMDTVHGLSANRLLTGEMLGWAEERARAHWAAFGGELPVAYQALGRDSLSISIRERDVGGVRTLTDFGYMRSNRGALRFAQSLDRLLAPTRLPAGIGVRYATDADIDARVDVHRDAWSVWGNSGFSSDLYRRLRKAPLYDATLDVVLEGEDGRFLSYCIGWADHVNRIGHFEPVGTRPAFAGRGLGKITILEGLRRLQERGMQIARVGTASINHGAERLYRSAGFVLIDREWFYTRQLE